jgi:integrase
MSKLTVKGAAAAVAKVAAKPSGPAEKIMDGAGLFLLARPGGGASWVLRATVAGKRRDLGLGAFPEVGLAAAREAAQAARAAIRAGRDPAAERQPSQAAPKPKRTPRGAAPAAPAAPLDPGAVTFRDAALAAIEAKRPGWSNPKHAAQWTSTLEAHAFPVIGAKAVRDVAVADVLAVLRPMWTKTPETASRVRQRIEGVLDLARVRGWREGENPARWRGLLAEELPPPRRVRRVVHRPALAWQEAPAFWQALGKVEGQGARALAFTILTAARTGEVRLATWREMDLGAAVWAVPAARMKSRRLHRVPLSRPALALLETARREAGESPDPDALVFGNRSGGALSDMTVSAVCRRMNEGPAGQPAAVPRWRDMSGAPIVPHGFRSTFRDWCSEAAAVPREIAEAALAHVVKGVEGAYARSDHLERRRPVMERWGAFLTGEQAAQGEQVAA